MPIRLTSEILYSTKLLQVRVLSRSAIAKLPDAVEYLSLASCEYKKKAILSQGYATRAVGIQESR